MMRMIGCFIVLACVADQNGRPVVACLWMAWLWAERIAGSGA